MGHLMFPDGQNRGRATGQPNDGRFQKEEECFFPDGCAALYRRELLVELGGFDEDFFVYADDADLGVPGELAGMEMPLCSHSGRLPSSLLDPWDPTRPASCTGSSATVCGSQLRTFHCLCCSQTRCSRLIGGSGIWLRRCSEKGAAGRLAHETPLRLVVRTLIRSLIDGTRGIPAMWRKRRQVFRSRRISSLQFIRKLWLYRISARDLTFRGLRKFPDSRSGDVCGPPYVVEGECRRTLRGPIGSPRHPVTLPGVGGPSVVRSDLFATR